MNDQTTLTADEQAEIDRAAKIAEQNDRFRRTWGADVTVPGQIVVTRGVASLSAGAQAQIMRAVQTFDTFTEDNDPYGDHTFGAFEITTAGEAVKLFWKIDLYDTEYTFGSAVPEDTAATPPRPDHHAAPRILEPPTWQAAPTGCGTPPPLLYTHIKDQTHDHPDPDHRSDRRTHSLR